MCDLLITIGTSLKVQPFASLIDRVDDSCPRLLINLESVGEMDEYDADDYGEGGGSMFGRYREEGFDFKGVSRGGREYARDVRWLGQADEGIKELARALHWEKELDDLFKAGRAALDLEATQTRKSPVMIKQTSKQEAESVAADIGRVVDDAAEPAQGEAKGEVVGKESEDQKFDDFARQLGKLDVDGIEIANERHVTESPYAGDSTKDQKGQL